MSCTSFNFQNNSVTVNEYDVDDYDIINTHLFKEMETASWSLTRVARLSSAEAGEYNTHNELSEEKYEMDYEWGSEIQDAKVFHKNIGNSLFSELQTIPKKIQNTIMNTNLFKDLEKVSWSFAHFSIDSDGVAVHEKVEDPFPKNFPTGVSSNNPYLFLLHKQWNNVIEHERRVDNDTISSTKEVAKGYKLNHLPIHAFCVLNSPLDMMESLIEMHPMDLRTPDEKDMLPLHIACENGLCSAMIQKLVDAYPSAVFLKDGLGRTPFDLAQARESKYRLETMEILISTMEMYGTGRCFSIIKAFGFPNDPKEEDDYSFAPLTCSKCRTLLLKFHIRVEPDVQSDNHVSKCHSNVFFCISCRKDVVMYNGRLDNVFERSIESLYLVWNPFDGVSSWISFIREKIIECYKVLTNQETMIGIEKIHACRTLRNKLMNLVQEDSDNIFLKLELYDSEKVLKDAKVQLTLVESEMQSNVKLYKEMEKEILKTFPGIKQRLLTIKEIFRTTRSTPKIVPMLYRIQEATRLLKDHVCQMTNVVFSASTVLANETEFMNVISEMIVELYYECIVSSDCFWDLEDRHSKVFVEMKSLRNKMSVLGNLKQRRRRSLPILCSVDTRLNELLTVVGGSSTMHIE